jgi:molybdenum cofactor synthesis domain-containing protein
LALLAKVLTVSSSVHAGSRDDRSGPAVAQRLETADFAVVEQRVVTDGLDPIAMALRSMAGGFAGFIVTTGGTGFGPMDLTPEATLSVIDRDAPGLAEASRMASPLGGLSRGRAGTIGSCLVLNLPGSPKGAVESLEAVLPLVPHALQLLAGRLPH